jgi:hypothetical protein
MASRNPERRRAYDREWYRKNRGRPRKPPSPEEIQRRREASQRKRAISTKAWWEKQKQIDPEAAKRRKREYERRYERKNKDKIKSRLSAYHKKRQAFRVILRFLAKTQELEQTMDAKPAAEITAIRAALAKTPTEELKREFRDGLSIAREKLLRLAAVLAELESRGETVEGDGQLLGMLRRIASGELLVDTVVKFAKTPRLMTGVGRLSPDEQRELLDATPEEAKATVKKKRGRRLHSDDGKRPSLAQMALGSPRDVADMCLELIRHNSDPAAVAEQLLPELQRLKQSRRREKVA